MKFSIYCWWFSRQLKSASSCLYINTIMKRSARNISIVNLKRGFVLHTGNHQSKHNIIYYLAVAIVVCGAKINVENLHFRLLSNGPDYKFALFLNKLNNVEIFEFLFSLSVIDSIFYQSITERIFLNLFSKCKNNFQLLLSVYLVIITKSYSKKL